MFIVYFLFKLFVDLVVIVFLVADFVDYRAVIAVTIVAAADFSDFDCGQACDIGVSGGNGRVETRAIIAQFAVIVGRMLWVSYPIIAHCAPQVPRPALRQIDLIIMLSAITVINGHVVGAFI